MKKKTLRTPMTPERIFLITMILTFVVGIAFLIKNLLGGNAQSALIIGICLGVFAVAVILMNRLHAPKSAQMIAVSILLVILVLLISLNSGAYYSDDFPLFLALIALTGLYLEPKCTLIQTLVIDVALVIMYIVHPEKADSLSQYIMCAAIFNIAGVVNFLVIRRGRAYIDLATAQTDKAGELLDSIRSAGDELQASNENSNRSLSEMRAVEDQLQSSSNNLLHNSNAITRESDEVNQACGEAYGCVQATEESITAVNQAVNAIEGALADSRGPMDAMDVNLNKVKTVIHETGAVFAELRQQMVNISALTGQLGDIAFNTRMLALNASIEAARAGQYGAGFSVVANEVQTLAASSDACSTQVTEVVEAMQRQVEISTRQIAESISGIDASVTTLGELAESIRSLFVPFQTLHENLDVQNENVATLNTLFNDLNTKVSSMNVCSSDNHAAVQSIMQALDSHKVHVDRIIEDTRHLQNLSASLLEVSNN